MRAEVFKMNKALFYVHPKTKKILPAPAGTKAGQRIEVPNE